MALLAIAALISLGVLALSAEQSRSMTRQNG